MEKNGTSKRESSVLDHASLVLGHVLTSLHILKIIMCYTLQDFNHHNEVRSGKNGHQTYSGLATKTPLQPSTTVGNFNAAFKH